MEIGQPTLDQLRIFLAVAEEGSFQRAARKLGRAISVVSYGIAGLESQLDVRLFDRQGSRLPRLTEAGAALVPAARAVADDADALVARMRGLRQGLEPELSLALDVMVPGDAIARVFRRFQHMFPTVPLRLHVEALGAVAALVLDGRATFAVAGPDIVAHPDLQRQQLGPVRMVPVAAPGHPLAQAGKTAPGEAGKHLQLVLTDRSVLTAGKDFSVLATSSWRLGDLSAKHVLLREGVGWGYMPQHAVAADIAAGALVVLDLPEAGDIDYMLHALWRKDATLGPAACWALDAFDEELGSGA